MSHQCHCAGRPPILHNIMCCTGQSGSLTAVMHAVAMTGLCVPQVQPVFKRCELAVSPVTSPVMGLRGQTALWDLSTGNPEMADWRAANNIFAVWAARVGQQALQLTPLLGWVSCCSWPRVVALSVIDVSYCLALWGPQDPFSENALGGSDGKPPLFLFLAVFSTTGFQVPSSPAQLQALPVRPLPVWPHSNKRWNICVHNGSSADSRVRTWRQRPAASKFMCPILHFMAIICGLMRPGRFAAPTRGLQALDFLLV